ncbi:hypothetical protein HanRHA438_Chr14g0651611 [Helianthus annuus]|nr:hypothetical protein HanRHA438_Chr14g0651611 [Helianthus annuus]
MFRGLCEGRESSGRYFRIRKEMTASTFGVSPLEDLLDFNNSDYQFYCFISMLRAKLCFKLLRKVLSGD